MTVTEQPVTVLLRPDLSALESRVDELTSQVRELVSLLKGEVRPGSYTPRQFADILHVDVRRVYEAIRSKDLRAVRIGGQWRIPLASAEEFMDPAEAHHDLSARP